MAKIKVCNDCGAVRTSKECSRCLDVLGTVIRGSLAGAELAQRHPGLVAAMLEDLRNAVDEEVLDDELNHLFDTVLSSLRARALTEQAPENAELLTEFFIEYRKSHPLKK